MAEDKKVDERRSFLGPDSITSYYIAAPTSDDIRGADWEYSKMYTRCLMEGITTAAEMLDLLRRRGIIGPEFEQRSAELSEELTKKTLALENAESMEEKRELAIEVAAAREELFQWNQRQAGPMNNTCEQISDDVRLEYLTACMIETEDRQKVWDSYDEYLIEQSQALAVRARFEVMLFLQGLDSDFLEQTPEAQAMREIESDILKQAEDALRTIEQLEKEEEEKKEQEEKKKTKPKRKTKSKTTIKKTTEKKSENKEKNE